MDQQVCCLNDEQKSSSVLNSLKPTTCSTTWQLEEKWWHHCFVSAPAASLLDLCSVQFWWILTILSSLLTVLYWAKHQHHSRGPCFLHTYNPCAIKNDNGQINIRAGTQSNGKRWPGRMKHIYFGIMEGMCALFNWVTHSLEWHYSELEAPTWPPYSPDLNAIKHLWNKLDEMCFTEVPVAS